jgi:hypothetical protein
MVKDEIKPLKLSLADYDENEVRKMIEMEVPVPT